MSIEQTVENVRLRYDAVSLTRKHFWRLLGMLLMIILVTSLLDRILSAIGDWVTKAETDAAIAAIRTYAASPTITAADPVTDALIGLFTSPKFLGFNLVYIVITCLVNNGLGLGRHAQMLSAAVWNDKPKVLGGFSRMRYCFKAWRLSLWVGIKIGLWALPGFGCLLIGSELQTYGQLALSSIMSFAGVVLLFLLTFRAGLSYCMATYILADEPDRGVRECVTFSKGLMQYRRWQAFKLGVPMVLKMIGTFYAGMLFLSLEAVFISENPATALVVILFLLMILVLVLPIIYFSLQFDMVYALFYGKRREPEDPSTSYWLRDPAPVSEPADLSEESPAASPEDTHTETTEEKENSDEEPVC